MSLFFVNEGSTDPGFINFHSFGGLPSKTVFVELSLSLKRRQTSWHIQNRPRTAVESFQNTLYKNFGRMFVYTSNKPDEFMR